MAAAPRQFADQVSGGVIGLVALLSLALIAHHPTLGHVDSAQAATAEIRKMASLDRMVHGGLLALMALLLGGMLRLTQRLGFQRPAPAFAFVAFALGVVMVSIAAVFDGFVNSDLGERCAKAGVDAAACSATVMDQLRFSATAIQAFTNVGLVAMSAGFALWGVAFLHRRDPKGLAGIGLGILGLVVGVATVVVMVFAPFKLTPHTLLMVFGGETLWYLAIAAFLLIARPPAEA
jgi:hypothetical protein